MLFVSLFTGVTMKQVQHIQALFGLAGLAKPKKPSRNGAHQPSFLSALFQGLCALV